MSDNKELTPEQRIAALEAQLAEQKELAAQQEQIIKEQHSQINEIEAVSTPAAKVLTIDKKKYQVVMPLFSYNGKSHTAESLSQDKELQKELVKIGAGVLKEIV